MLALHFDSFVLVQTLLQLRVLASKIENLH